jgi:very-short-patch-repair endonuclease/predicted transcriptional regulator of viral defense system
MATARASRSTDDLIADIAAGQLGLITRDQLLDAGISARVVERRLSRGSIVLVRSGLYRSRFAPETWHQRALGACLGRGSSVVVSHHGAAFLHGFSPSQPSGVDVIAPLQVVGRGLRVHRAALEPSERTAVHGIPVTSKARTVADLAASLPPAGLCEMVDKVMVGACSPAQRGQLFLDLNRYATGSRRGSRALRSALSPWTRDQGGPAGLQSALEVEVLRVLLRGRLPRPVCQHPVRSPRLGTVYVDFAWPERHVGLEVDGFQFHAGRTSFDKDRLRGNGLLLAGWNILHTTSTELRRDPAGLVQAVKTALGERRVRD